MVGFAFRETEEAAAEITRLFDFVWPTAVALWNLRWQVDGFLSAVPGASYEDVASRFVLGSDIAGADIRAMRDRITWDQQKERFAEFILTNAFAIYESWTGRILTLSNISGMRDSDLYTVGNGTSTGLAAFIARVTTQPSPMMQLAFQPGFMRHRKVHVNEQENLLRGYKYFKEIRNCLIHRGSVADQRTIDALNDFLPVSSAASLKSKERIECLPLALGDRVRLSLRGAVGLCDIVLKILATVDAQLSSSETAEKAVLQRLRVATPIQRVLGSKASSVEHKIKKICRVANLPPPSDIEVVKRFLLQHRLVSL